MARRDNALFAYGAVTAAYWAFMLSDGALRMLVLLHFHTLGFSPITLAWLFLLYEIMGVVTNLSGGWLAARFGLTSTLYAGLALQIAALGALSALDPNWSVVLSVTYVMLVQGASGIAKDLAKMSAKSAVKLLAPTGDGGLFRWVAILTGSKNAVKGLGFLLGTVLLGSIGFVPSLWLMAGILAVILISVVVFMPSGLPAGKKGTKFSEVFSKDPNINRLSLARMFLFGARDTWFVVGIPIFFYAYLSDGSADQDRIAFFQIGGFMAIWIILYGIIQALAPKLLNSRNKTIQNTLSSTHLWAGVLTLIPCGLGLATLADTIISAQVMFFVITFGLLLFGAVFALNSALHSYLILALSDAGRVTMNVGFYYMSNAAGRLLGTLLSGVSYQLGGLALCLFTAALLSGLSWLAAGRLRARYTPAEP